MNASDRLRQAIDQRQAKQRTDVFPDRQTAVLALLRTRGRLTRQPAADPQPARVTGLPLADPGGTLAPRLCLEVPDDAPSAATASDVELDRWAEHILAECARLAEAEVVLTHIETRFMRLRDGRPVSAGANPLATLHARLSQDAPVIHLPADVPARAIALGPGRLAAFPSYAAYRTSTAENGW